MIYKVLWFYNLIDPFQIDFTCLLNSAGKLQKGYFTENPYHNPIHILDSIQGMHFVIYQSNMNKTMKREDLLTMFIANLIHDYEHPGYLN